MKKQMMGKAVTICLMVLLDQIHQNLTTISVSVDQIKIASLRLIVAQFSAVVIHQFACKAASSTLTCAISVSSVCPDAASRVNALTSLIATRSVKVILIVEKLVLRAARRATVQISSSVMVIK